MKDYFCWIECKIDDGSFSGERIITVGSRKQGYYYVGIIPIGSLKQENNQGYIRVKIEFLINSNNNLFIVFPDGGRLYTSKTFLNSICEKESKKL